MRSIFLLFLYSLSVKSQENATLSDLDNVFAKLLSFGDTNNTFPVDEIEAKNLCDRYRDLAPKVANFSRPLFLRIGFVANQFMTVDTVCQLYEKSPKEMALFAAEVNAKSDQLSYSYQKYINLGANIGQDANGTDFCNNYPLINCFFHKYFGEVKDQLTVSSQIIYQQIYQFNLDISNKFGDRLVCDWSDIPLASYIQFRAINLNMLSGLLRCLNKKNIISPLKNNTWFNVQNYQ